MLQWYTALDAIGIDQGWRIEMTTKSACAFSDALSVLENQVNETCADWNQSVLSSILADPPDVLISSQRHGSGLLSSGGEDVSATDAEGIAGLVSRWIEVSDLGVRVLVMLDNPSPIGGPVYQCVSEQDSPYEECFFDRRAGVEASAAPSQLAAASEVGNVGVIDLTDLLCPGLVCPPVIGGVLVYRQGSHITDTYVRSLAPFLAERLLELVES